jgi:pyruvate formate lyase activating enzyme
VSGGAAARFWQPLPDGRIQCTLCPRDCQLHEGQRGACFVREMRDGRMQLTTYGRSSGFCIDPIEKKPLNHFYPGSPILSFGTAGCNLSCRFCQNSDISKTRDMDRLQASASPQQIAATARQHGCPSVAYTYNDPIIFAEYAIDTALACRERGIRNVAVTAGYIHPQPAKEFFAVMDAANVDLKAFSDDFYHHYCGGRLQPVLDTLVWLHHASDCWLEITTLLIPGLNDSAAEITALSQWMVRELGPAVPLHFTAFHPAHRLLDRPRTPPATLQQARRLALDAGLQHVYTGNIHDPEGAITRCSHCARPLILRDGYRIQACHLDPAGRCPDCQTPLAGRFSTQAGSWGNQRQPLRG